MGVARISSQPTLRLPRVITATLLVAVLPSLAVAGLLGGAFASSPALSIPLATLASLGVSQLCGVYWERGRESEDVLFGDLMIWGWAKRRRAERRLASTAALFGPTDTGSRPAPSTQSAEPRIRLLKKLATDLEASDPYTHGHSRRVARYATLIASQLGLAPSDVAKIRTAAALHDVGKVHTPIAILHKPGRLTDEEFAVIKRHPVDGARMIGLQVEDDAELEAIVLHHHERLDGTGYPSRLSGTDIPLGARIIAVADTFDAITSKRPYRPAKPHKAALDILRAEAGTQLDPDAVRAFCRVYFSRRPVGALAAVATLGERGLAWVLAGGVNAARVAGVAAATALGGAALAPSNSAHRSTSLTARPVASLRAAASSATALSRIKGSPPRRAASGRLRRSGTSTRPRSGSVPSSGGPGRTPISAPAGTAGSGAGQSASSVTGGSIRASGPSASGGSGPGVSATLTPASSGPPAVGATVSGGSAAPSASASVNPGGSTAPSASASVNPGGPAAPSASVHVGGSGLTSSGVHVGGP
jgi:putative nucleotidyltransferase with HDIG domain